MSDALFVEIPMHGPEGRYVNLSDLLPFVPGAQWTWQILEFTGIGEMPDGLSVAEFEEAALAAPLGVAFNWAEVQAFASRVEQVQNLILVAVAVGSELDPAAVGVIDLRGCPFMIEAIDSTEWIVSDRTGSSALAALRTFCEARWAAPLTTPQGKGASIGHRAMDGPDHSVSNEVPSGGYSYSPSDLRKTRWGDSRKLSDGTWETVWNVEVVPECSLTSVSLFRDESIGFTSTAVFSTPHSAQIKVITREQAMSTEYYPATFTSFRIMNDEVAEISTIQGLPRDWYAPLRGQAGRHS